MTLTEFTPLKVPVPPYVLVPDRNYSIQPEGRLEFSEGIIELAGFLISILQLTDCMFGTRAKREIRTEITVYSYN